MAEPARLQRLVAALWPGLAERDDSTPDERRQFDEYATYSSQINAPRLLWFVGLAALLTWPLDALLTPAPSPLSHALFNARLVVLATVILGGLIAPRLGVFSRHPELVTAAVLLAALAASLVLLASAGGMRSGGLGGLVLLPLVTVPVALRPRYRAGVLAGGVLVVAVALWVGAREHGGLGSAALAALVYQALLSVAAMALGHRAYLVARHSFLARVRLSQQDDLVRDLSENLESRVAEKALALRRLARHIERMREDERKWIAREIHDELGQELTAMRFAVALARHTAGPQASDALNDLQGLLDRTRTTMRRILAALRPRVLDELGLVAGLDWLTKDLSARAGLSIHLEVEPGDLRLDGDGATVVFRIVQEALSNVLKHAQAQQAWVQLRLDGARLSLVVADDGLGLPLGPEGPALLHADAEALRPGHGLGLLGIRERADAVGGSVELATRPEGGTRLRVVMPFPIFPAEGAVSASAGSAGPGIAGPAREAAEPVVST